MHLHLHWRRRVMVGHGGSEAIAVAIGEPG